jgi:hypothetical protein
VYLRSISGRFKPSDTIGLSCSLILKVQFYMLMRSSILTLAFAGLLFTNAGSEPTPRHASNRLYADSLVEDLWRGTASFRQILQLQIESNGRVASRVAKPNLMNGGTQIVAMSNWIPKSHTWYLFNREYDYGATQPANCPGSIVPARIVVRASQDQGSSWSPETVIAEPDFAAGECEIVDGHAFYDADKNTWHYISQMQAGLASSVAAPLTWNINHYSLVGRSPMSRFTPDSSNPVVKNGQLWTKICSAGKSCPERTEQEGTPEISFKEKGYFYVTFHGAYGTSPVWGYRGIAKTTDFHTWLTHGDDPADSNLPDDALWSKRDCAGWNVLWNATTGCIGGGHASTLMTPKYTYMLIESADLSLACTAGQNWVVGLVRTPNDGKPQRFVASGHWQQFGQNPLINSHKNYLCSIQYPRFFVDGGKLYLIYWTLATIGSTPSGAVDNQGSYFHVARLESDTK